MGGNKLMFSLIKTFITMGILWILIAFTYVPVTNYVEKHQLVDKTKQSVYNIIGKVKKQYE
jgi:hypothetical protein